MPRTPKVQNCTRRVSIDGAMWIGIVRASSAKSATANRNSFHDSAKTIRPSAAIDGAEAAGRSVRIP